MLTLITFVVFTGLIPYAVLLLQLVQVSHSFWSSFVMGTFIQDLSRARAGPDEDSDSSSDAHDNNN